MFSQSSVRRIASAFAVVLATALPASAAGSSDLAQWADALGLDMDVSYSGTRVMTSQQGNISMMERRAPGKQRMEMSMGGMNAVMIIREDREAAYTLMPDFGMYRETSLAEAQSQTGNNLDLSSVDEVGREKLDGVMTTKYAVSFSDGDGNGEGFMWVSDDGIGVKMDMTYSSRGAKGQRIEMLLTDVKIGRQPDDLFEVPANYKPMNMANMGAMMGGGAQSPAASQQQTPRQSREEEPAFAEELGDAAADEAKAGVEDGVRDQVRKGIRGIFGR